jgi:hypothetical protein
LLTQGKDVHTKFLGAQSLYQKLQNDFDNISTGKADDPVIQLRDTLFGLMVSQGGDNGFRMIVDRLSMCLAYIALKSCLTFWPNSITQIIAFGSENLTQCH